MGNSDDSWDFKVDKSKVGLGATKKTIALPKVRKADDQLFEESQDQIEVKEGSGGKRKSRRELAKEYEREEDKVKVPHPDTLYGSFYRRSGALLIDVFIVSLVAAVGSTYFPVFFIENETFVSTLVGINSFEIEFYLVTSFLFIYLFLVFAPHVIFGTSFGKKMMNIKVFGPNREKQGFVFGIIRELLLKPAVFLSVVGALICFFSKKRKMLHDHIIGSEVHRE